MKRLCFVVAAGLLLAGCSSTSLTFEDAQQKIKDAGLACDDMYAKQSGDQWTLTCPGSGDTIGQDFMITEMGDKVDSTKAEICKTLAGASMDWLQIGSVVVLGNDKAKLADVLGGEVDRLDC